MPVWPFSFIRLLLYVGCVLSAAAVIGINKIIAGPIMDDPPTILVAVLNFSVSFYVIFILLGLTDKVAKYEANIMKKDINKLLKNSNSTGSQVEAHTIETNESIEADDSPTELDRHIEKMNQAEATWKHTPHNKRNDFQKFYYYINKLKICRYISYFYLFIATLIMGLLTLNAEKFEGFNVNYILFLIIIILFFITSSHVFINKKFSKYEKKTRPEVIDNLFKIMDIE